jgi:hypothetical protein
MFQASKRSADLSCKPAALSFKSPRSHRLANARGQLSGHGASGGAEDARALLRQKITTPKWTRFPTPKHKTLTVHLHHLTQVAHDEAVRRLCDELNASETLFPGTDLRLIYKVGSC